MRLFRDKDLSEYTDMQLLRQFRDSGRNSYVGELYKRYTHLVFGVCMKYLKHEEDARDAVMEIFEKLLADLRYHEVENFRAWLYSVTKNTCLMRLRKVQGEREKQKNAVPFMESEDELHLFSEDKTEEELEALEKAVAGLKTEQRTCIELFYFENMSYNDISEKTGYSQNEVKSHLQNGRRNLKKLLEEK